MTGVYRSYNVHLSLVSGTTEQNTSLVLTADLSLAISPPPVSESARVSPRLLLKLMAPHGLSASFRGGISIDLPGRRVIYLQEGEETDLAYLQTIFNLAADLVEAYPQIVALGGVAVPALIELTAQQQPLRYVAAQCLYGISQETKERLWKCMVDLLLCPECLIRCAELPIHLSRQRSFYYGCLRCGQSQQFLEINDRQIIVVLDRTAAERFIELPGQVRVNWFAYAQPFDFNEVEIIQADDEAVERFAVQLGNDTDPIRRPRYRQMRCRVATDCSLSVNTIRILQSIFGEVEEGNTGLKKTTNEE